MGISRALVAAFRARKRLKAIAAAANEEGARNPAAPAAAPRGFAQTLANVLGQALGPELAASAPNRGGPLPGSDRAVADGSAWSGELATAAAGIAARDAAFDIGALTTFADQVFAATTAVWGGRDAGTVRPVMSDGLWAPLAAVAGVGGAVGPQKFLVGQRAETRVTGLHAGRWYDSAQVSYTVRLTGLPQPPPDARQDPRAARFLAPWLETWLFQRSVLSGGDPMARPESCPACGASTQVDSGGACTHCHQPVPYLTAGWLVTAVASASPFALGAR